MTVRIERLTPEDWARWRAVRVRALQEDHAAFACSAHLLGARAAEDQWREALETRTVWLAVDDAGLDVAMIGLTDVPELISMWVAPQARRSGVGAALVDEVLAAVGDRAVSLRVMNGNEAAIEFYTECGFRLEGRTPDDEGTLRMRRDAPRATSVWPAPAERPLPRGGRPPARSADQ